MIDLTFEELAKSDFIGIDGIEFVKVVKCKDCRNGDWYKYKDGTMFCYCMEHGHGGFTHNDFCSRGERIDQ